MKSNVEILTDAETTLKICLARVQKAKSEAQMPHYSQSHSRSFAAAKRSALDCKAELTKLTQSSKYKYSEGE